MCCEGVDRSSKLRDEEILMGRVIEEDRRAPNGQVVHSTASSRHYITTRGRPEAMATPPREPVTPSTFPSPHVHIHAHRKRVYSSPSHMFSPEEATCLLARCHFDTARS